MQEKFKQTKHKIHANMHKKQRIFVVIYQKVLNINYYGIHLNCSHTALDTPLWNGKRTYICTYVHTRIQEQLLSIIRVLMLKQKCKTAYVCVNIYVWYGLISIYFIIHPHTHTYLYICVFWSLVYTLVIPLAFICSTCSVSFLACLVAWLVSWLLELLRKSFDCWKFYENLFN